MSRTVDKTGAQLAPKDYSTIYDDYRMSWQPLSPLEILKIRVICGSILLFCVPASTIGEESGHKQPDPQEEADP